MTIFIWLVGIAGAVAMVAYESYWFAGIVLAASFLLSLFTLLIKYSVRLPDRSESVAPDSSRVSPLPPKPSTPGWGTFPASKVGKG